MPSPLRSISLLLTLALGASLGHAIPEQPFQTAFEQFQSASRGDSAAVAAAAQGFQALLAAEPAHPLLLAYAGSATSLRATTTMLPWKKMSYAEEGLDQIDKALGLLKAGHEQQLHRGVSVALETRFVAATTFLNLPSMFNRGARGSKLMAEVLDSPMLAQAPAGFQAAVRQQAAKHAAKQARKAQP